VSLFASGRVPQVMAAQNLSPGAGTALPVPNPLLDRQPPVQGVFSAPLPSRNGAPAENPFSGLGIFFLSVFLFFLFSRVLDFWLGSLHLPLIFSSISLLIALASGAMSGLRLGVMQLLIVFTAWLLICTPFSVWRGGSFDLLKEVWSRSLMAGFIVACLVQSSAHALRIVKVLCFAFLVAGVLGLFMGRSLDGRLILDQGTYSNPNDYAVAILYGCVCWLYPLLNRNGSMAVRAVSLGVIAFLFLMLLKTGSRGAMITAIITFLPVFWRARMTTKIFLLVAGPLLAALFLLALPPEMRSRYLTFLSRDTIEKARSMEEQDLLLKAQGSSQQRLQLLKDAALLTIQNPIFGVGPGMFSVAQNDLSVDRGQNKGAWLGTHNTYLQVSSEIGFPGLALFLAILVTCWRDLRRLERYTAARRDEKAEEVRNLALVMRLLLISSCVFFFFEHVPFGASVPVLSCWIAAFARSAQQELGQRPTGSTASLAGVQSLPFPARVPAPGILR